LLYVSLGVPPRADEKPHRNRQKAEQEKYPKQRQVSNTYIDPVEMKGRCKYNAIQTHGRLDEHDDQRKRDQGEKKHELTRQHSYRRAEHYAGG
jgi:hypothetical protein